MKIKKIYVNAILQFLEDKVLLVHGSIDGIYIDNLAEVERVNETTLDWIKPSKPNKQEIAESSKARVLLVDSSVLPIEGKTLIVVKSPKVALAEIGNHFFVEKVAPGIHPTATIHPEAKIGDNCHIGPYTVIGKTSIGENCIIDAHVRIYDDVVMGHDCVVKSGAVLGGAGFGYERDVDGDRFRFPQIGQLIMGDFVEVGSNTCIDRGALADTVIGDYTKINNLCHIAHNNKIGRNVMITGCVNISGSNVIDDNVWIAPNASVRGWVHIGEGATVGMAAVVVKDIPAHETWVGNPARKLEK
ncbi:MAG: UDP-3-O-[3-hydroxymyristoyl] glucosamine N-acyltransferase [bacterium F083]|nr:MAG: UDP-3-O-[3-hydroxymyristoyl] glucosamine N-acyltransferase [bacterium F083]